ncbi:MAG: phage tail assembly chaperone [Pseudomonadota bacterium]
MSDKQATSDVRNPLAWRALMEIFLGQLAFTPDAFWKLSLPEVDAALVGKFGARAPRPTRDGLDAMMQRFPDQEPNIEDISRG